MKKWLLALTASILLVGCNGNESHEQSASNSNLKKVQVVLDWTPNTNHTGLYVAQQNGYFEEQGLDVEIILPGEAGAIQLVAAGQADFGIGYQEGITEARTQGVPIVSIAAIIQHNTSGFAAPVEKEITSPVDFQGKTYGGYGAPVEEAIMKTIMEVEGADVSRVNMMNIGSADYFTAVKRDVDFSWIYYGWTGIEAELRGEELDMLYVADYDKSLDYYTPVVTTSEKMIAEDSETVEAFLHATSKGYEFAIEKPEEAAAILIKAEPDLDADLVQASQKWLSSKYQDDAERWGEQKREVWSNYADWMKKNDLLEGEFVPEEAFTNEFLPQ